MIEMTTADQPATAEDVADEIMRLAGAYAGRVFETYFGRAPVAGRDDDQFRQVWHVAGQMARDVYGAKGTLFAVESALRELVTPPTPAPVRKPVREPVGAASWAN